MKQCYDCKNFIQHYGINKELGIFKIECGHCVIHKSMKNPECPKYELGDNQYFRERKFYLSKAIYQLMGCIDEVKELINLLSNEERKNN